MPKHKLSCRWEARGPKLITGLLVAMILMFSQTTYARTYGQMLCKFPGFHCVKIKRNQSWNSLFPDPHVRSIVMRINRLNTQVWQGMVIAVPNDLENADIMDFSPFPRQATGVDEKIVVVDPENEAWGAYDAAGTLLRWGPISAGAEYCRDIHKPCYTHPGTFRIFSLGSSDCYSTKFPKPYGGAPMPYCMYFNNGQALHGEPNGLPGYNASHGCVRMYVNDAEWLRYDFVEAPNVYNNFQGTKVWVKEYSLAAQERIKKLEDKINDTVDDSGSSSSRDNQDEYDDEM